MVNEGLCPYNPGKVGYTPEQLNFPDYCLRTAFDHLGAEEAAARILSFSRDYKDWVGVSWRTLGSQIKEDGKIAIKYEDIKKRNEAKLSQIKKAKFLWITICILTAGIYFLFKKKPTAKFEKKPKLPFEFSLVSIVPQEITQGIHFLIGKGYLRQEGGNKTPTFYPTLKLLDKVSIFTA